MNEKRRTHRAQGTRHGAEGMRVGDPVWTSGKGEPETGGRRREKGKDRETWGLGGGETKQVRLWGHATQWQHNLAQGRAIPIYRERSALSWCTILHHTAVIARYVEEGVYGTPYKYFVVPFKILVLPGNGIEFWAANLILGSFHENIFKNTKSSLRLCWLKGCLQACLHRF